MKKLQICVIVSGSIAAYKACELCRLLIKAGHEVQFVVSEGGSRFIGEVGLEALSGRPVYTDIWARRESMTHISLRKWTDLYLFYPATANRINAMAAGLADDLIGAVFLANNFEKPFWIAPAMNSNMLAHPATQKSLATLQSWGAYVLPSAVGELACGDQGDGRLLDPQVLLAMVQERYVVLPANAPRAIVSGGAMTEQIDAVRYLGNSSSGRTAQGIVKELLRQGWQVDYVHHQSADVMDLPKQHPGLFYYSYTDYSSFSTIMEERLALGNVDAVVQAAAVSDYHISAISVDGLAIDSHNTKIDSSVGMTIRLEPNPKFLSRLRSLAPKAVLVGFKLSAGETEAEGLARSAKQILENGIDFSVWNDFFAYQGELHPFVIQMYQEGNQKVEELVRGSGNATLAQKLVQAIIGRINLAQGKGQNQDGE